MLKWMWIGNQLSLFVFAVETKFVFVLLQLVFGSFESTYIADWLGLMIMGRLACAKLTNARRAELEEEQALVEVLRPTLGIDLDADPEKAHRAVTSAAR